jgi:RNA polymerase primary sigma factor
MISPSECNRPDLEPAPPSVGRASTGPGLSRREESVLAARVAAGDREARDRLVEANLGLVVTIARRYLGRRLELDDLIGEGNLGLIQAAEGFDPRLGTRFSTFAAICIRRAIGRALTHTSSMIRLPGKIVGLLMEWRRAERALGCELGRAPSFDEIARSLGLNGVRKTLVSRALNAGRLRLESSFDSGLRDGLCGAVADRRGGAGEGVDAEDERAVASRLIAQLDGRERTILMLRFGLEGEGLTLEEIGRRLGVTRERVRQIEGRALSKLRQRHPQGGRECDGDSIPPPLGSGMSPKIFVGSILGERRGSVKCAPEGRRSPADDHEIFSVRALGY